MKHADRLSPHYAFTCTKKLWLAGKVSFTLMSAIGLSCNSGNDPITLKGLCHQAGLPTCTMTSCKSATPPPPQQIFHHWTPHTRTRSSHGGEGSSTTTLCYNVQRWKTKQGHSWCLGRKDRFSGRIRKTLILHKILSKSELLLWLKHNCSPTLWPLQTPYCSSAAANGSPRTVSTKF